MELSQKKLEEKLDLFEKKFYLLMQQYKKNYVSMKMENSHENINFFNNTINIINTLHNDVNKFEKKVTKMIKNLQRDFENHNLDIEEKKILLGNLKEKNIKLKQASGTGKPFKDVIQYNQIQKKSEVIFYLLALLGLSYIIITHIMKPSTQE
jgi:hypothetical protein